MNPQAGNGTGSVVLPAEPPFVPEATLPPLPDTLEADASDDDLAVELRRDTPIVPARARPRSLRAGCYLLRYTPAQRAGAFNPVQYAGTMRVERDGTNTTASGDLYVHRPVTAWPGHGPHPTPRPAPPSPAYGIPIFPIRSYRYYVRVTKILEGSTLAKSFVLGFELHRFDHSTKSWTVEGPFSAKMAWAAAPVGYPSTSNYLQGEVRNASNTVVGRITMGWISKHLRRAVLEIDRVADSEAPLDSGTGVDWKNIFNAVGWDLTLDVSDTDVTAPSGESWSDAEMHAAMLARRDSADLDREWRYHLICVRRLDSTDRGIMYDAYGGDSNNIPREGAGIASHWTIPSTPQWGLVAGMRFGTATAPYYRTAVHEIGHALGLYHNSVDNGFMHTTPDIAASAVPPEQFPNNVIWAFAPDDQRRLRHFPDIWVRPGGIAFGASYTTSPISPADSIEDAEGLAIAVEPLLEAVPIGAPVRIGFTIRNGTDNPVPIPGDLTLKGGFVRGRVVDPSGTVRTFWPVVRCIEEQELRQLDSGADVSESLTILRGAEGALFPSPGVYRITVEVEWSLGESRFRAAGDTALMVTGAVDEAHASAALRILSTPDTLLTLVVGGDHLTDGIEAIQVALENPVLRPHFAYIEAKRVGKRFGDRDADVDAAADILSGDTVLSPREAGKAAELIGSDEAVAGSDQGQELSRVLEERAKGMTEAREGVPVAN